MTRPSKEQIQRFYRQALDRCLDHFSRLSEDDWRKKASKVWTARDYLAHLAVSQEEEMNRLTAEALEGKPGQLPGFTDREHMADYNEQLLASVRGLSVSDLMARFRAAHEEHLRTLDSLSEEDLNRPASNPGWSREGTVRDLFLSSYLHLAGHYQDIRRAAKKKLPHWMDLCPPEEVNFQLGRTFHFMPLIYWPQRGGDLRATFLFTMEGEGGGQWAIQVADGRAEAQDGAPDQPDTEIRTRPAVWMDLSTGDLNAAMAVMTRKVRIQGNAGLAMRLEQLFEVT